jgi:hypothetical protein
VTIGVTVQLAVPLQARVVHASLVQVTVVPEQTPLALHTSLTVQALLSSHWAPVVL